MTFDFPAPLEDATVPELPKHYRGKVRDNYDLPDGRRILIASDRVSAFDKILASIPCKGQALTQIARFWFEQTADICPNHTLEYPDPNVVVGKSLKMMPVEMVVRGYLAGTTSTSLLTMYRNGTREMYGHRFPDDMRANQRLPKPIITPTTKAALGAHDEPLSEKEILERCLLSEKVWREVSQKALALFTRGQEIAAKRGLILADTKYEFGLDEKRNIILADEIHTPDSSRYWLAASYESHFQKGEPPKTLDKDFIRNWVAARCDPSRDQIPPIPQDVIHDAARVYISLYERITGNTFVVPDAKALVLDRIRKNLAKFF